MMRAITCLLIVAIALIAADSATAKTRDPFATFGTPTARVDSHGKRSYYWPEVRFGHLALCQVWLYRKAVIERCIFIGKASTTPAPHATPKPVPKPKPKGPAS